MSTALNISQLNKIKEEDFDDLPKMLSASIWLDTESLTYALLQKKELFVDVMTTFFEKCMELDLLPSREHKVMLIRLIDKLNSQKELLALRNGEINEDDLKIAARRLGKKSQSAFSSKG
jgi:hypothetical protein